MVEIQVVRTSPLKHRTVTHRMRRSHTERSNPRQSSHFRAEYALVYPGQRRLAPASICPKIH